MKPVNTGPFEPICGLVRSPDRPIQPNNLPGMAPLCVVGFETGARAGTQPGLFVQAELHQFRQRNGF
jgi:hypothetical protein